MTPTLFLVLGPLGQSTTAVNQLADMAPQSIGAPYAGALGAFAVVYGVPVMGFALLWLALSAAMLVRAARDGMGFAMTWWALTFPVGTCVTGAAGLARHTGLTAFAWLATALFLALLTAWLLAAAHTLRGLFSGRLLAALQAASRYGSPAGRVPISRARPRGRQPAARSAAARTRGASASEGPYQVRWRPLIRAAGRPGKASGPSPAVKRYGSSGSTTRSQPLATSSSTGTRG